MSRITAIQVTSAGPAIYAGLKGQKFALTLHGVDILVGRNGAGKTTRGPLAIAAALEGLATTATDPRRPYVGTLPADTVVVLTTDNGGTVTRALDAKPGTKSAQKADDLARSVVGIPPTAWDLSDFATGTDGDRHAIIDAVARAGGQIEAWDAVRAQDHTRAVMLADSNAEGEEWTAPLVSCISTLATAPSAAAWLRAAITWATDHTAQANRRQKESDGHLGEMNDNTPSPPAGTQEAAQKAYGAAVVALTALDSATHERGAVEAARARYGAEGKRLAEQMKATEADGKRLAKPEAEPVVPDTTALVKAIEDAKAEIGEPIPLPPGNGEACRHCGKADPIGTDAATAAKHVDAVTRLRERVLYGAKQSLAQRDTITIDAQAAWNTRDIRRTDSLGEARKRWQDARAALTEWEATDAPKLPAEPDEKARTAAAEAVSQADTILVAHRNHAAHLAQLAAAAETYKQRRSYYDASRCLVASLRQTRDDVAAAAYRPIDDAARALLADAPGLPVPFFDAPDAFGAIVPGSGKVAYAGLSESEQRITAAAIVYALATVAGCPCRLVLLDGLEVVQHDHRAPLLTALCKAQQAGLVDTVVVTMATAPGEDLGYVEGIDGLTVQRVGGSSAQGNSAAQKVSTSGQIEAPF